MTDIIVKNKYTFPKEEKLCSEKSIDKLFIAGESFIAYPLRIVFLAEKVTEEKGVGLSILTSVSKKKFKQAVKRNRVKRLTREAYRLNKDKFSKLANEYNLHIDLAFIYLNTEIASYKEFEKAVLKTARMLSERIDKK